MPPEPVLTRWGTWLKVALFYSKYFKEIKGVIDSFDPKESTAIDTAQKIFVDKKARQEIMLVYVQFGFLANTIN